MLRLATRLLVVATLVWMSPTTQSQLPPPTLTVSQMVAADLGRRLDEIHGLLDEVRSARDAASREAAMQKHWAGLQAYMAHSLQLLMQQALSKAPLDSDGCRLVGGHWHSLSFPGLLSWAEYLGAMQGLQGRMRLDVRAMRTAQHAFALEAVMRAHWRSNYDFLQRMRGLGWMFDHWMPVVGAARLPEADSEGAELLVGACSACHAAPHPQLHTRGEWGRVISAMTRHIEQSDGGIPKCVAQPSEGQLQTILDYLVRHAR